ncbi:hypothetical protein O181_071737 [Austropuccinia psidii MF-1]|uniref:Integrase catalytic domain-containing protein n=1 Tax=Austropuccinia psidii MF-1 TaxID=1389203 RepID=A0A9Q3F876_9BASI|nr:hypothetical protein [Austropuccinia psidii MF-1]
MVVPNDPTIQLNILKNFHYSPLAGHAGKEKTRKLVKWDFHWSGMTQFIKDCVSSHQKYSRNKNIHHKKLGLLKSLPIPNRNWIFLSINSIAQLLLSSSFDSIIAIVDRFSKMKSFISKMFSITSQDLAQLFIIHIISKCDLPSSIFSERCYLFVSSVWKNLFQKLKLSRDLTNAYHPETYGKTERVNQILENYFRMYVSYNEDDWDTWLPLDETSYNNFDQSPKKQSPSFNCYGRDPQFDLAHITQDAPA